MWKKTVVVALIVAAIAVYYKNTQTEVKKPSPVIQISNGKLQGVVSYSRNGKEIHEYLGIPYAKPPMGEFRFESPQPALDWDGVKTVNTMPPKCLQIDIVTQQRYGITEDCLFLNVFVPKVDASKKRPLPVLVWIHGGIFMYGSTDIFGGKYFADEEVILVTINYRLASFGFLNTNDGVVRGNMGLKDQVMALKWVQKEIHNFGGDPSKVTIFGESAGASSTHLHQLSPMSKGLFYKAISQSGTAISPFVLCRTPAEQAKRLGSQMGCPTRNSKELVACLKKVDAIELIEAHRETNDLLHESIGVFSPTIETIKDDDAFLTEDPLTLLQEGKIASRVPWINGVNSEEGLILSAVIVKNETILNALDKDWNDVAPKFFFYHRNDTLSKLVRKHYFGKSKKIGVASNLHKFTKMLSDRSFFWPASESASLQAKVSPVYLYYYSHVSDFSLAHLVTLFRGRFHFVVELIIDLISSFIDKHIRGVRHHNYGCSHADEQFLQFNTPIAAEVTSKNGEQYKMSRDFVKLWADFAKDEKNLNFRGVKWPPVDPKKSPLKYLMIDMSYGLIDQPFRIDFWKDNPVY